mgnify:CR=1 FL=1
MIIPDVGAIIFSAVTASALQRRSENPAPRQADAVEIIGIKTAVGEETGASVTIIA